jgi:hypothetical protein
MGFDELAGKCLLSETDAARVVKLKPKAMEGMRYRGEGPAFVRLSRRCVRYRLADLMAWIDEHRVHTSARDNC